MLTGEDEARRWLASLPEWDAAAAERLALLVRLLTAENAVQNLVAAASLPQVWQRHVADSAQLLAHVPRETSHPWLDLGTGAGFPGLVIAALHPESEVVMVESRPRRSDWLERARRALDLPCARIVAARLEAVPTAPFRVISARAFAPLGQLLDISARFSTADTVWLLPKGRSAPQELADLQGWRTTFHVEQSLTDPAAGVIVGSVTGAKPGKRGKT